MISARKHVFDLPLSDFCQRGVLPTHSLLCTVHGRTLSAKHIGYKVVPLAGCESQEGSRCVTYIPQHKVWSQQGRANLFRLMVSILFFRLKACYIWFCAAQCRRIIYIVTSRGWAAKDLTWCFTCRSQGWMLADPTCLAFVIIWLWYSLDLLRRFSSKWCVVLATSTS